MFSIRNNLSYGPRCFVILVLSVSSHTLFAKNVFVIGEGSTGGYIAALFERDAVDVTSIGSRARADSLYNLKVLPGPFSSDFSAELPLIVDAKSWGTLPKFPKGATLFITVKTHQLSEIVEQLKSRVDGSQTLVFSQNGVGIFDSHPWIRAYQQKVRISFPFGMSVERSQSSSSLRISGQQSIRIALPKDPSDPAHKINELLKNAEAKLETYPSVQDLEWKKLMINIYLNGPTAISNKSVGEMLSDSELLQLANGLLNEAATVGRSLGVDLSDAFVQRTKEASAKMPMHITSMLEDIRRGSRSEWESLYGAVQAYALQKGIPTPLTDQMCLLLKNENSTRMRRSIDSEGLGFCGAALAK